MKVKTSVTLSDDVLCQIDREIGEHGNRSQFIEKAVKRYFRLQRKAARDAHDAAIYRKFADKFNAEAELDLQLQAPLDEFGDDAAVLVDEETFVQAG